MVGNAIPSPTEGGDGTIGAGIRPNDVMPTTPVGNDSTAITSGTNLQATPGDGTDVFAIIEQLHGLFIRSILSSKFEAKKTELLGRL